MAPYKSESKISLRGFGITTCDTSIPSAFSVWIPHSIASLTAATSPVSTTKDLPPIPVPCLLYTSDAADD